MGLGILRRDFLHCMRPKRQHLFEPRILFMPCQQMAVRSSPMPNWKVLPISCEARFQEFSERRRGHKKCYRSVSWKVGHYPSITTSAPIARKRPSFVSLRSFLILLSRIVSRIPTQIQARLWSLLFVTILRRTALSSSC